MILIFLLYILKLILIIILSIIELCDCYTLIDILNWNNTAITICYVEHIHRLKIVPCCSLTLSRNICFLLIILIPLAFWNSNKFIFIDNNSSIPISIINSPHLSFFCLNNNIVFIIVNYISNYFLSILLSTFSLVIYRNWLLNVLILCFVLFKFMSGYLKNIRLIQQFFITESLQIILIKINLLFDCQILLIILILIIL